MADKHDRTVNPDGADTEETQVDGTPSSPRRGDDTTWTGQDDDEAGTRPHAGDRAGHDGENDDGQDRRPDDDDISLDEPAMSPEKKTAGT